MDNNIVLKMEKICKYYPGVTALDHVDFELRKGEVHALLGENGAGKSTLCKIIAGAQPMDNGSYCLDGEQIRTLTPQSAKDKGVSMIYQELLCRGWFLPPNTYDCGSFVVNGTAVVGKELKHSITAGNQHTKELTFMKSLFEQMGGTYRQVGDYLIPNLSLPEKSDYQIGKYGRLRRNYLKEYHPVLYANFLTSGTLHRHLAEIDQACNERMEIIISDMAKQDGVTETLKVADQMEWVRRMNSIRSRAEEIVLTELVYE